MTAGAEDCLQPPAAFDACARRLYGPAIRPVLSEPAAFGIFTVRLSARRSLSRPRSASLRSGYLPGAL